MTCFVKKQSAIMTINNKQVTYY